MPISSFTFLGFILVALISYYLLPLRFYKRIILFSVCALFYWYFGKQHIQYLAIVIVYSYIMGLIVGKIRKRTLVFLAVIPVVAGLGFYKYADFAMEIMNRPERFNLIAPIGISFFTFKSLGYLVEVYRGKCEPEKSPLNFAIYLSFFPQILSGPIQKASEFLPQLNTVKKMNIELIRHGFLLMFFGAFEKMVIADRLAEVVKHCFFSMETCTPSLALIGTVAYTFQLYSDFDSYSNIAIGLGEMFGFECNRNFHVPYLAKNIKEFWNRWHISLSQWLKENIYFSLGGNRKGWLIQCVNIIIVFLISGLWHGAAMNFVLWGLLNAVAQIIWSGFDWLIVSRCKLKNKVVRFVFSVIGILMNFILVNCLWVFFRCASLEEVKQIFTLLSQVRVEQLVFEVPEIAAKELQITLLFTALLILVDILRYFGFTIKQFSRLFFPIRWIVYLSAAALFIFFAVYGSGYDPSKFIYISF